MAVQKSKQPLDTLDQMFNEVLVQTGKLLRTASKDGKSTNPPVQTAANSKIPASIDTFNRCLDDLECQIMNAKAVIQRDLRQLRDRRKPAPQPEPRTAVPPAPMVIDLEPPPKQTAAPSSVNAPAQPFSGFTGPSRPVKQEQKPVAPFPNMGLDLAVPPTINATPSPKLTTKGKDMKNSPRPGMAGINGRPASAPPKKETKIPPPQPAASRSAASTPQTAAAHLQARSGGVGPQPGPAPSPAGPTMASAQPAAPAPDPGSMFTNMTFTLAPAPGERPGSAQQQQSSPEIDLVALGAGDSSGFAKSNFGGGSNQNKPSSIPTASMMPNGTSTQSGIGGGNGQGGGGGDSIGGTNAGSATAAAAQATGTNASKMDNMFDLGSNGMNNMDMDYDLGGDGGDNSNFNDLYFNTGDDNTASNDYDNAYFSF